MRRSFYLCELVLQDTKAIQKFKSIRYSKIQRFELPEKLRAGVCPELVEGWQ